MRYNNVIRQSVGIGRPAGRQASTIEYVVCLYLQNINSKVFYKGLMNDFDRRLKQYLSGRNQATRKMLPLRLVHVEICGSRLEARKLEKFFKSGFEEKY